jgi:hypothetical protein
VWRETRRKSDHKDDENRTGVAKLVCSVSAVSIDSPSGNRHAVSAKFRVVILAAEISWIPSFSDETFGRKEVVIRTSSYSKMGLELAPHPN